MRKLLLFFFILSIFSFLISNLWIEYRFDSKIKLTPSDIMNKHIALVLGTIPKVKNGNDNLFFTYRIQAATELWNAGKITHFIVSGDNHEKGYDEPSEMKKALIKNGIPASKITCDYAGFRTFDSMERCKKVFQQNEIIIVSQEFHNERALFLAKAFDISAIGYNAKTPPKRSSILTHTREYFARFKAFLDVYVLFTESKFLGSPVKLIDN